MRYARIKFYSLLALGSFLGQSTYAIMLRPGSPVVKDSDGDGVLDNADCAPLDVTRKIQRLVFPDADGDKIVADVRGIMMCVGDLPPKGYVFQPSSSIDCDDSDASRSLKVYYRFRNLDGDAAWVLANSSEMSYGACINPSQANRYAASLPPNSSVGDCNDNNASLWIQRPYTVVDKDGDGRFIAQSGSVCSGSALPPGYATQILVRPAAPELATPPSPDEEDALKLYQERVKAGDCNDNEASVFEPMVLFVDLNGDGRGDGAATYLCTNGTIPTGYAKKFQEPHPNLTLVTSVRGNVSTQFIGNLGTFSMNAAGSQVIFQGSPSNLLPELSSSNLGDVIYLKNLADQRISLLNSFDGSVSGLWKEFNLRGYRLSGNEKFLAFTGLGVVGKVRSNNYAILLYNRESQEVTDISQNESIAFSLNDISFDGKWIVYTTSSGNLYLANTESLEKTLVGPGDLGKLSKDAKNLYFVARSSVGGDSTLQIFRKDLETLKTEVVSSSDGSLNNRIRAFNTWPSVSESGSVVAWYTTNTSHCYVKNLVSGELIDLGQLVNPTRPYCSFPSVSPNGNFVVFSSNDQGVMRYDLLKRSLTSVNSISGNSVGSFPSVDNSGTRVLYMGNFAPGQEAQAPIVGLKGQQILLKTVE